MFMKSQFYQLADVVAVLAAIASNLRNFMISTVCKRVISQPLCEMDVTPGKRMKIVTLNEHTAKPYKAGVSK